MRLELLRMDGSDAGVFGVLRSGGQVVCCTLEPPYLGNRQFVSCIPEGGYACRRIRSPRFGETFEVCDVPGRDAILFHAGNTVRDTSGCILLGTGVGMLGGVRGITSSRAAFREFLRRLEGVDEFRLTITSALEEH